MNETKAKEWYYEYDEDFCDHLIIEREYTSPTIYQKRVVAKFDNKDDAMFALAAPALYAELKAVRAASSRLKDGQCRIIGGTIGETHISIPTKLWDAMWDTLRRAEGGGE